MAAQETIRPDQTGDRQAVLVTAASRHGATAEIAEAIGKTLAEHGFAATVIPPGEVSDVDGYDAVILGSAVYTGHWLDAATDLVERCRSGLAARPVWLFSSGPVGEPTGKLAQAMANDQVELPAIRAATGARDHQMFTGKLDCWSMNMIQRAALLAFPGLNGDFRDWDKIRQWANGIAQQLAAAPVAGGTATSWRTGAHLGLRRVANHSYFMTRTATALSTPVPNGSLAARRPASRRAARNSYTGDGRDPPHSRAALRTEFRSGIINRP